MKIMKRTSLVFAVSALFLGCTSLHAGTILLNENFNSATASLDVTSAGAFHTIGWTNVDIVSAPSGWASLIVAPESGNVIDLDGSGGIPMGDLQSNSAYELRPGVDYYLSFDLVGSQRGNTTSTTVTFGNYSQTFTLASTDDTDGLVTNALVTVTSPTWSYLTFASNTPGAMGALLDNIEISSATATPEPSTLLLLGSGFAMVALLFARGRRKSLPTA
jgi:PEP-CTERM motif